MANAPIVVTGTRGRSLEPATGSGGSSNGGRGRGGLFENLNFFLLQKLPTRTHLVTEIESNGGKVVKKEQLADYIIADHLRADAPAGSYSYTFITDSVKAGELQSPARHAAGPRSGTARETGSVVPPKGTRTPFSKADDVVLWEWVERAKLKGESILGNDVYKQLEAANPRHTYQSWRDHYIKKLMDRPPPLGAQAPVVTTSVSTRYRVLNEASGAHEHDQQAPRKRRKVEHPVIEDEASQHARTPTSGETERQCQEDEANDLADLLREAGSIERVDKDRQWEAWACWQTAYPSRTIEEWQALWWEVARPIWLKQQSSSHSRTRPNESDQYSEDDALEHSSPVAEPADVAQTNRRATINTASPHKEENAGFSSDQVEELLVTSDANQPADSQFRRESGLLSDEGETTNAFGQAIGDANDPRANRTTFNLSHIHAPTHFKSPSTSRPTMVVAEDLEDETMPTSEIGSIIDDLEDCNNTSAKTVHGNGAALTEANLAAQEAQHKSPENRGFDLPKDDDMKDQSHYAEALRALLYPKRSRDPSHDPVADEVSGRDDGMHQQGDELTSDVHEVAVPTTVDDTHPVLDRESLSESSSRADTNYVLDTNLNWPAFQQNAKRENGPRKPQPKGKLKKDSQPARIAGMQFTEIASQLDSQSLQSQVDFNDILDDKTLLAETKHHDDQAFSSSSALTHEDIGGASITYANMSTWTQHDRREAMDDLNIMTSEAYDLIGTDGGRDEHLDSEEATRLRVLQRDGEDDPVSRQEVGDEDEDDGKVDDRLDVGEIVDISSTSIPSSPPGSSARSDSSCGPVSIDHGRSIRPLDTQDIWNVDTQQPDFSMPLPDDDLDEEEEQAEEAAASLQPGRRSSQAGNRFGAEPEGQIGPDFGADSNHADGSESQQEELERLDSWMTSMEGKGYKEDDSIRALQRTSMRPDLAELVLIYNKSGKGLPHDVPGIWSEEEDIALEGGNAKHLRLLEQKHGWGEATARMQYLQDWREA